MRRGWSSVLLILFILVAASPVQASVVAGQGPGVAVDPPGVPPAAPTTAAAAAPAPRDAPAAPDLATDLARLAAAVGASVASTVHAVAGLAATALLLTGNAVALLAALVTGAAKLLATAPPQQRLAAARAAGGLAVSGVGASLARRLPALGLYSRMDADDLLDHEVRQAMVDHLREHPGTHVSALAEALDLAWGTVVYHLDRLLEARLVVARRHGSHKCLFVNGGEVPEQARQAIPVLKNERAREVVAYVTANPAASQKEVGSALGMSPGLVSWHVQRLADVGLLRKERRGRGTALFVHEETAAPALAVTA